MSTFTRGVRVLRHPGPFELGDYVARPSPNAMAGWVKGIDLHGGRILVEDADDREHWVGSGRFIKVTSRREIFG